MARRGSDLKRAIDEMLKVVAATPGWSYSPGAHSWKIRTPDNTPIFISKTPSDYRGVRNVRAQLIRHGLVLGSKGR
jgi:hypothetical protein